MTQNANSDGDRPDRTVSCADTEDARAHQDAARGERVKAAVRAAGGRRAVSSKSGIPEGTLGNYQRGRDIPSEALVALADACGVRIEWLAAGRGTMKGDWAPPQPFLPPLGGSLDPQKGSAQFLALANRVAEAVRLGGGEDELAQRTGITPRMLLRYLVGNEDLPDDSIASIAEATGVSKEWLATGDGSPLPLAAGFEPAPGLSSPSSGSPRPPPPIGRLNALVLAKAMEVVEALSPTEQGSISMIQRARRVIHVYELLVTPEADLPRLPMVPGREPQPDGDGA